MRYPTIWTLDDSAKVRVIMEHFFRKYGYPVEQVLDSPDAVQRMLSKGKAKDVFVVDNKMESQEGITICEDLRSRFRDASIFLVSAYLEPETVRRAQASRIVCLPKSSDTLTELKNRVDAGSRDRDVLWYLRNIGRSMANAIWRFRYFLSLALSVLAVVVVFGLVGILEMDVAGALVGSGVCITCAVMIVKIANKIQKGRFLRATLFFVSTILLIEALFVIAVFLSMLRR